MKLSSVFSDHMVLQRDQRVAIWGWGVAGDRVTVKFAGQEASIVVGKDGRWLVRLEPMKASAEPREMVVSASREKVEVRIKDVLVGDVWVGSGQSNMEWSVGQSANAAAELAAANHGTIRLFGVPRKAFVEVQTDVDAAWQECTPKNVENFSAVAYYFGRALKESLGVPIGLINSSWGGTRIEAWMSKESLKTVDRTRKEVEAMERSLNDPKIQESAAEYTRDPIGWTRKQVIADPENAGFGKGWASAEFDDTGWREMKVPARWTEQGHPYSGVFWFRREVDVPAAWAGKDLVLAMGACDKHDTTYFNNVRVGAIGWEKVEAWCTPREYRIPGGLVRAGKNVIATRIYSYLFDGGLIGPENQMKVSVANDGEASIPLAGYWKYEVESNFGFQAAPIPPLSEGNSNAVHILYDSMIHPLLPLGIRGVIWYQGESNEGYPKLYRELFPLMIRDWRKAFGQEFAFLFVQLANYKPLQTEPSEGGWATLREAQTAALEVPGTGMAVAIDVGDAIDIHPKNKQEVGRRLALAALAKEYGKDIVYSGPLYQSHAVEKDAVRVRFAHVAEGLRTTDDALPTGFAIAGADGKFVWAEARIEGDGVVLRNPEVKKPAAVRYGWAMNPCVNLVNSAGLPASPFRTDEDAR